MLEDSFISLMDTSLNKDRLYFKVNILNKYKPKSVITTTGTLNGIKKYDFKNICKRNLVEIGQNI